MMLDPVNISTFVAVFGGITAYVIKELKKNKNDKSSNGDIKEIKETTAENLKYLNKMDKDLGIVNTNVENMKSHCETTTGRFQKKIDENRDDHGKIFGKLDKKVDK